MKNCLTCKRKTLQKLDEEEREIVRKTFAEHFLILLSVRKSLYACKVTGNVIYLGDPSCVHYAVDEDMEAIVNQSLKEVPTPSSIHNNAIREAMWRVTKERITEKRNKNQTKPIMYAAQKKSVRVSFITFRDFVDYGRDQLGGEFPKAQPTHFMFQGNPITHETDECYLVPSKSQQLTKFTPGNVIVVEVKPNKDTTPVSYPLNVMTALEFCASYQITDPTFSGSLTGKTNNK